MSSKGGGVKRKHAASASSESGARAQRNKQAVRAAKKSKAHAHALAAGATSISRAENEELGGGLLFESDDEDAAFGASSRRKTEDIRIRGFKNPKRRGGDGDAGDDDDEDEDGAGEMGDADGGGGAPLDPYAHETPDETRVRLARAYLKAVEQDIEEEEAEGAEEDEEEDAEAIEEEKRGVTRDRSSLIDARLKRDLALQRGTLKQVVCHERYDLSTFPADQSDAWMRHRPAHRKGGATCIAMSEDCTAIYTGGKDTNLMAWDTETGKVVYTIFGDRGGKYPQNVGHSADILTVAVNSDGNLLASAGKDSCIKLWDVRAKYANVRSFDAAHKGAINSIAFRMGSNQLFSCAEDRTIKIWNMDQLAYVETLYGHTSDVMCVDALYKDRCLSVSRDKTARLWKIVEETQLMFRASVFAESLDALAMVNEDQFITGGQDGTICAWHTGKKKPTSVIQQAHGGKWINAVGCQKFNDVVFSGSSDGFLNLYCLESSGIKTNKLNMMHRIPVKGHINGIVSDAKQGRFVALAIGPENRVGRWDKVDGVQGGLQLISLAGVEKVQAEAQERAAVEQASNNHHMNGVEDDDHEEEEEGANEEEEEEQDERKHPAKPAARKSSAAAAAQKRKPAANKGKARR